VVIEKGERFIPRDGVEPDGDLGEFCSEKIQITTDGVAARNVERNKHVALSIQRDRDGKPEWMVAVRGMASVIDEVDEIRRISERIYRKYLGDDREHWPEEYRQNLATIDPERIIIEIGLDAVSYRGFDD
jgi:arginine/lysine/ornithine decarboxylase